MRIRPGLDAENEQTVAGPEKDKEIYFHLGLHKTASTFLQESVFPCLSNIHFIKKHDFRSKDEIIASSPDKRFLLSRELEPEQEKYMRKIREVAVRYPDTRPILILRSHGRMIKSKYKYYIRKHGCKHFDHFFDLQNDTGVVKIRNLDYCQKIRILEKHFAHPVFVMFQEEFINKPFAAIDALADYVGADYRPEDIQISAKNASFSEKQLRLIRKFNQLSTHDHSRTQSPFLKFVHRKLGDGLLYLIGYAAYILPESFLGRDDLIPPSRIHEVDQFYTQDWHEALRYAHLLRPRLYVQGSA
ncbi:hypothetical protein [Desulfovermiculus halophilus]|jgi:hypothetical protein|uniref:hypothetical protein n=1 Tax=Desulfovermiculus halophilus TaxID=339722 RepID=UPI00048341BB|nr:hypothetical protein [Desulfovermiculus halophilus]